jgi:hypothetical protein
MRDLYSYSLSPDHFAAAMTWNARRVLRRMHTSGFVQVMNGLCLGTLAALAGEALTDGLVLAPLGIPAWTAGAFAIACIALSLLARHGGIQLALRKSTFGPGVWKLGIDDDGLWSQGPHGECFTRWSGWRAVEEHGDLVLLYHDDVHVHPIPFAAFESPDERRAFVDHVRAKIAEHPEIRSSVPLRHVTAGAEPGPAALPVAFAPGFRSLMNAAVRIAALRPVAPSQLMATWVQVVGLVLATLIPPIAFAAASIGEAGHVAWQQLPAVLFHVPVILVTAIMVAHLIGRGGMVVPILTGALLAWTAIDFVSLGLWLVLQQVAAADPLSHFAFYYLPLAWLALAVARLALSFIPQPGPRLAWVVVTCVLFLALPLAGVQRERSLWSFDYSRVPEEARAARRDLAAAASEEAVYRQAEILQRELAALQPGRKGVVDVFLVGMAGYGHQDVFMREVEAVATLFRERFDADGRIVKLVNNPRTILQQPLATATSLEASLKRVGEAMDPDEDVLVLFLTSHGSHDHQFSIELRPLELRQITPQMLRGILDRSGIRNRVVIVSACYAGGFLRQLEGPNTLVIAAAAPDKNSFGCTNEAEWTYFGKAYFDEALRQTTSFTRAFEIARPRIEERERAEKFDPSNPQISEGAGIKAKLEELERQLVAAGRP